MATGAITADETLESPEAPSGRALLYAAIVIVAGIFATTLAQPQVLGRLPLQNLLKNELHISRTLSASFFFLCGLPWYAKPLAGIFTDAFPILGSRRKSYALISVALGVVAWGVLFFTPHEYGKLLQVCLGINAFMMVASTVVGAYMVETAQAAAMTGRLTSLRNFVDQVCLMIRGPVAGVLASISFGWTAVACGSALAVFFPVALFVLIERRRRIPANLVLGEAGERLVRIVKAWPMWLVALVMVAFYLAPGLSTALFYKQQNDLHMTAAFQGTVVYPISAACGIAAAAAYAWLCRRVQLHWLLLVSIALTAAVTVGFVAYNSIPRALVLGGVYTVCFTMAELAFMDLAIRATPKGSEGMGFSALMSVRNICLFGADVYGSALLDKRLFTFEQLVLGNAAITGAVVILAWFVPHHLVRRKDAEIYERAAMPPDEFEPA